MANEEFIDHRYTSEPICPYCGHEHDASYMRADGIQETRIQCEECNKEFDCDTDYEITYITKKLDCVNNLGDHKWEKLPRHRYCKVCGATDYFEVKQPTDARKGE